ncbi:MAG: glycosyltransferase family 4 protein [Flavobacteriaceae bacterium]
MESSTVLIIGLNWPEPKATAAGTRMMELINCFLHWQCKLTFASTAKETERSAALQELGIEKQLILLNDESFDSFVEGLKPDIVIFDRFIIEEQFGWRVAQYAPEAIRILDTEDLHSLRHSRKMALKQNELFNLSYWTQNEVTKREIASIYRCDLSLIISSYEMELLQEHLEISDSLLLHLPFLLDTIKEIKAGSWLPFEARKHFVFIGTGKHTPNTDAIHWLKREVWPLIKAQLPETELHIYGAYLPESIMKLNDPNTAFLVHGWVEDIDKVLSQARVNLAALRYGAGLKGKIVRAMTLGTPSAMTQIAAEGIFDNTLSKASGFDKEAFVEEAVGLYRNKTDWESRQRKGVDIINKNFNKEQLQAALKLKLEDLQHHKEQYRANNFIGGMLLHHTMMSSKYLAKWIASKNAKNNAAG